MLAYRAEFLVWLLIHEHAAGDDGAVDGGGRDGPVGRFGQRDFVAYYLGMLIVRILTGSWLVWELTMEIGTVPWPPAFCAPSIPCGRTARCNSRRCPCGRLGLALGARPLLGRGERLPLHDPARLAIASRRLPGRGSSCSWSWPSLARWRRMWKARSRSSTCGWARRRSCPASWCRWNYCRPGWRGLARYLPFRYILGFPVETLIGLESTTSALHELGVQGLFIAGSLVVTLGLWRAALKRFAAFGG